MAAMPDRPAQLAVIGAAACADRHRQLAFDTGRRIAEAGAVLLCGGRGGVMEAAAEGAKSAGGTTVGILPGASRGESPPNPQIDIAVFTGLGQARNQVLVLSADAVIGVAGGWGTLTEIGFSLKHGIPVVLLESWELSPPSGEHEPLLTTADTPSEAVRKALAARQERYRS